MLTSEYSLFGACASLGDYWTAPSRADNPYSGRDHVLHSGPDFSYSERQQHAASRDGPIRGRDGQRRRTDSQAIAVRVPGICGLVLHFAAHSLVYHSYRVHKSQRYRQSVTLASP